MNRFHRPFAIAVLFAVVSTPALAVFPDFKAADFYTMLGLKPTARRAEVQDALNRADFEIQAGRNRYARSDHAHVLAVARETLLSDGEGRRAVYDEFLSQGLHGLTVLDQADYMERAELAFKPRDGESDAVGRMRALRRTLLSHPIADIESKPIAPVKSPYLTAKNCGISLAVLAGGAAVTGVIGLAFKYGDKLLSESSKPSPSPAPAVKEEKPANTTETPGKTSPVTPSDPGGVFVGTTPDNGKGPAKDSAPTVTGSKKPEPSKVAETPKEKPVETKAVPAANPLQRGGHALPEPVRKN